MTDSHVTKPSQTAVGGNVAETSCVSEKQEGKEEIRNMEVRKFRRS